MNISELMSIPLFKGMSGNEIQDALTVLQSHERTFKKDEMVLHAGDPTGEMGIVLSGNVILEYNDLWGTRTILDHAGAGGFFAENYALINDESLLIDIRAGEDCQILFIRAENLYKEGTAGWHIKLLRNLLTISSRKNLVLSDRIFHTSPKTIRGRIMAYLDTMSKKSHSQVFDIPFDRQQMADYLNVERTALSKELGKMKREGLITYSHNHFQIKDGENNENY